MRQESASGEDGTREETEPLEGNTRRGLLTGIGLVGAAAVGAAYRSHSRRAPPPPSSPPPPRPPPPPPPRAGLPTTPPPTPAGGPAPRPLPAKQSTAKGGDITLS